MVKRLGDKCGKKFLSRLRVETKDLGGRVAKDKTDLHLNQLFLLPSMPCGKTGMPALPSELAMECCRCIAGRHVGGMVGGVSQRACTWPGTAGRFVNCRRIELSASPRLAFVVVAGNPRNCPLAIGKCQSDHRASFIRSADQQIKLPADPADPADQQIRRSKTRMVPSDPADQQIAPPLELAPKAPHQGARETSTP